MPAIERIHAREVFDSRGRPTVEVEVMCQGGFGRAIVPSGASTGRFEALELRDGDATRLEGRGVRRAVENVRGEIARALYGLDADDQQAIDRRLCELDGTPDKSRLGANAVLGTSLAVAHAVAAARGAALVEHLRSLWARVPGEARGASASTAMAALDSGARRLPLLGRIPLLPLPMVNMISGGLHAGGNLDVQDFLILPVGASSFPEALDWVVAVYGRLGDVLSRRGYEGRLVGDEGGYGPRLERNEQALELVVESIEAAGFVPGTQVAMGLDVAATHFACDGGYRLSVERHVCSTDEWIDRIATWVDRYPIISIEDPLAEDDWSGWRQVTERLGGRVQLIGDDLFVTQAARLRRGIGDGVANSVLIKLNQVGTLWETLETLRLALDAGYRPVVSARSGETEDATIADLSVATGAGQIKIGSVARSERLAKYNQLLRLAERLGGEARWLGGAIFDSHP
jgi:enolase